MLCLRIYYTRIREHSIQSSASLCNECDSVRAHIIMSLPIDAEKASKTCVIHEGGAAESHSILVLL